MRHYSRMSIIAVAVSAAAWSCVLGTAGAAAGAQLRSQGPALALGFSAEDEGDLVIPSLGWRWQFQPGETLSAWAARAGTQLTFAIEPQLGIISGDRDSFEIQALPLFHLEPLSRGDDQLAPYFEGGIGLIYSELRGFRLGSRVLFTDNAGVGVRLGSSGWSLGYRFRHISHAGIWANTNAGLNTHYMTLHYAIAAP